jgi:SRSO17 transposase
MSTILEHPEAQALLGQAEVSADTVRDCGRQLERFLKRYLPLFYRAEQRRHAEVLLRGKLTDLQRKTTEPIARRARLKRRPLQHFVGAGAWDDDEVLGELRRHAKEELAAAGAVLVLDGSESPKKGTASCGVARQWCGHLGKVENCQAGVFLAYASRRGKALVGCRLYLTPERAADGGHRARTGVPQDVRHQPKWRIGLALVRTAGKELPHAWVVGDDDYGRSTELRGLLRLERERYLLDVPCNTLVRDLSEQRPPSHEGGKPRRPLFERADVWAARQPRGCWRKVRVRGGEKGPLEYKVLLRLVQVKDEDGRVGPRERLVVIKSCGKDPQTWYALSSERGDVARAEFARAHAERHRVEELLEEGKQEVGLGHGEVRSWAGWHHHMTLSLLALWFLQLGKLRVAKKKSAGDGAPGAGDLHGAFAPAAAHGSGDRGGR